VNFPFLSRVSKSGQVGIEIRPEGIAVAISAIDNVSETFKIISSEFLECKAGQRNEVLKAWVGSSKVTGVQTVLNMSADQYQMFQVDRPEVEESELLSALQWKIRDMIDYELDDAVIGAFDFPEEASKGRDIVTVVCARKVIVKGYVDLVLAAGLDLRCIDITELSLRNVLIKLDPSEASKAILYLRKGTGMLVFCKGEILYFSRRTTFSFEGLNSPSEQQKVIEGLSLEIQRSMDYCESQLGLRPPKKLLMVIPETTTPLVNLLSGELAVSVVEADISGLWALDNGASNSLVALGGALRSEAT